MHRLLPWALLLFSLLPSLWLALAARELPQLGLWQEDSIHYNAGRSLAEGRGYRLTSLPGEPVLTRFPPLFPAYLAPFINNRSVLGVAIWVLAPCALALLFFWCRLHGVPQLTAALAALAVGASAPFVIASANLLPDLLTLALLLTAFYALDQNSRAAATLGAIAATGAYLTRLSLLPALLALLLYLLVRRRWTQAAIFAAVLAPAVGWWQSFLTAHADPAAQGLIAWYNQGQPQWHFSHLAPNAAHLPYLLLLLPIAIYGVYRTRLHSAYLPFAAVYLVALALGSDPVDARALLPILPLLFAGTLVAFPLSCAWIFVAVVFYANLNPLQFAHTQLQQMRALQPLRSQAYFWIDANTVASARFLAADEALLHAVTRRHALALHPSPRLAPAARLNFLASAPAFARAEGLDYLFLTTQDYAALLSPADRTELRRRIDADPTYQTVFSNDAVTIKRRAF